jgi:acetyltransferase
MNNPERVILPDNTAVVVRPIQPSDAPTLHAMHERLSAYSIYNRYLQYRRPTIAELERVCSIRPDDGAGLIVSLAASPEQIIGVAYFVIDRRSQPAVAEPAILIEDRFQRRGIGRMLWKRLNQTALARGVDAFLVYIHPDNRPMMQLIHSSDMVRSYTPTYYSNELRLRVDLQPASAR